MIFTPKIWIFYFPHKIPLKNLIAIQDKEGKVRQDQTRHDKTTQHNTRQGIFILFLSIVVLNFHFVMSKIQDNTRPVLENGSVL